MNDVENALYWRKTMCNMTSFVSLIEIHIHKIIKFAVIF